MNRSFNLWTHFICLIFSLSFATAKADLSYSQNARTFPLVNGSLTLKGLAYACLASELVPDSLPCSASTLPLIDGSGLQILGAISNGYASLEKTQRLLAGEIDAQLINDLFSGPPVVQNDVSAGMRFYSKYFSAEYFPASVRFFSVLRNEANPEVQVTGVKESFIRIQGGYKINSHFSVGIQAKQVEWKILRKQFFLLALTDPSILQPEIADLTFIEPSVSATFDNLPGKPRLTAQYANAATGNPIPETLQLFPELQVGMSISPTVPLGQMQIMLDYKSLSYEENSIDQKIHLGGLYRFGSMTLTGGVDYFGLSGGVYYTLSQLNSGIVFSTTKGLRGDEDYYAQTVYIQVGWQL